uniref:Choline/carnitine acyltransferase domain-containing protein n=1 Tax=Plectus sambesii TaxID=2011161 RepID=A0A914XCN8_9BILA
MAVAGSSYQRLPVLLKTGGRVWQAWSAMGRAQISTAPASFSRQNAVGPMQIQKSGMATAGPQNLPKLPVPALAQTVSKFLRLAKPITSAGELDETARIAEEFLASEGAELQALLEQRAQKLPNWLTPWWLNAAYLEARTPLPIVTSPGVLFPKFDYFGTAEQTDFAAKVISAALQYLDNMINCRIPLDKAGNVPFDMSQYAFLYGTTRIPQEGKDRLRYGFQEKSLARHIVIARHGHFFNVPVFDEKGAPLSCSQIVEQINKFVLPQSESVNPHQIGIVSSDNRDDWARVYQRLKRNSGNEQSLEAIETALFVVCLDKPTTHGPDRTDGDEQARQSLHGGGSESNSGNRWFDKTLQFVIGHNGYSGLCYEHTPAEGPPVANIMDFICDQFTANSFTTKNAEAPFASVKKLEFSLGDEDKEAIRKASEKMDAAAGDVELKAYTFKPFGKNFPKSQKLSPDSFIQLAFQLAYYRMHHKHPPTYETATLRKFNEGRTDTIRLPNPESAAFVEAVVAGVENDKRLAELLRNAIEAHKQYSMEAMNGQAIDRHLLGLKMTALEKGLKLPKLFTGAAYKKMQHFTVSTSQVPTRNFLRMCFGPSASDCYGICYNPQEKELHMVVSAFFSCPETSAVKFVQMLEMSLLEMEVILTRGGARSKL